MAISRSKSAHHATAAANSEVDIGAHSAQLVQDGLNLLGLAFVNRQLDLVLELHGIGDDVALRVDGLVQVADHIG